MNRSQALKVLRLDAAHNSKAIEQSYWSLVRRAQTRDEVSAQREIERLNEAYALLAPHGEPMDATARRSAAVTPSPAAGNPAESSLDSLLAWLSAEASRIRSRWDGRLPEAILLASSAVALALLALVAGAHPVLAVLGVTASGVAIWAPWRDVDKA